MELGGGPAESSELFFNPANQNTQVNFLFRDGHSLYTSIREKLPRFRSATCASVIPRESNALRLKLVEVLRTALQASVNFCCRITPLPSVVCEVHCIRAPEAVARMDSSASLALGDGEKFLAHHAYEQLSEVEMLGDYCHRRIK